jgi:hypothetical protein
VLYFRMQYTDPLSSGSFKLHSLHSLGRVVRKLPGKSRDKAEPGRTGNGSGVIYLIDYVRFYYWARVSHFHGGSRRGRDKRRIMEDLRRRWWERGAAGRAAFR